MADPASRSQSQQQQQGQPQGIDISTLPLPQLNQVKSQLTQELQHLTSSFQKLKAAQARFRDCIASLKDGIKETGTPILVPLTSSLYVPGTLASTDTVLVDVGTGFFVEKTPTEASKFYKAKVEELGKNLADLEKIVGGKQGNLNLVEDVMRQRMMQENSKATAAAEGKDE